MKVKAHAKRRVRYLVLEALYEAESSNHDPVEAFERRMADEGETDQALREESAIEFGRTIVKGVAERWREADGLIGQAATKYPVNTLAVVDRNILRLAIWELLADNSAPAAAVVNEAVELAHRYGGESSPAFVNAVLRTVSRKLRAAEGGEDEPPAPTNHPNDQENE